MPLPRRLVPHSEPNHRQEIAIQRIDLALSDLASVVMSCSPAGEVGRTALAEVRKAMGPVIADILSED